MRILALSLALFPLPAIADISSAVNEHILPATETFNTATKDLNSAAQKDCTPEALRPAYQATFDAWMGLSHLAFGPLETDGRALTIEFWPDPRGIAGRTVNRLIADEDPAIGGAESFAEVSVAGRGLMALDRILYDDEFADYQQGDYICRYVTAITGDLARMSNEIVADWQTHGRLMTSAGAADNSRYLGENEPKQALYTALLTTIEFNADQRLGRPLGAFDKPRPRFAEAYRSDRPLKNIQLSLAALRELAITMTDTPVPATEAAFDTAIATAEALDDPTFSGVEEPQSRLKVEILQQQIRAIGDAIEAEIGGGLGLTAGFNSKDGD